MASPNVTDYAAFNEYAARFGPGQASWAKLGIEHRADRACAAERARMTHRDRADRGRYSRQIAAQVARATASRPAWEACVREIERRHADAEAAWAAERRWTGLQAEIERRRPSPPASNVRAPVAAPAALSPASALPARPVPF